MNEAQRIVEAVSMRDLLSRYGLEPNAKGFVCCPLHNEKTPSMKVYEGSRGFCCFGCGAKGSVIDFVMEYHHIDFVSAIHKLDYMFNLGLFKKLSIKEQNEARRQAIKAAKERRKKEVIKLYSDTAKAALCAYRRELWLGKHTKETEQAIGYLDRLLDTISDRSKTVDFDYQARINMISQKINGRRNED